MAPLFPDGKGKIRVNLDDQGFMLDADQWNDKVAQALVHTRNSVRLVSISLYAITSK